LGSGVTDPSQKAEQDFREKYVLRSDFEKLLEDKDKRISELKHDKSKLQEKMEIKDNELLKLRMTNSTL
jgi:hypothetical protein